MQINDIEALRLEYMREPLFHQQIGVLIRKFGLGEGGEDMDVRLWQETDRAFSYLSRHGDLAAPMANSFYQTILHKHGVTFATLVMALLFIRTVNIADHPMAEGEELPHEDLLWELMKIGQTNREDFEELISEVVFNNTDYKGRRVSYDHYDPMERADTEKADANAAGETLTAESVINATASLSDIFGTGGFDAWRRLWQQLMSNDKFARLAATPRPKGKPMNMVMVCNVCGLLRMKLDTKAKAEKWGKAHSAHQDRQPVANQQRFVEAMTPLVASPKSYVNKRAATGEDPNGCAYSSADCQEIENFIDTILGKL